MATCREAQYGAKETDFRPRYPPDAAEGWLPPVSLDSSQEGYKSLAAMLRSEPRLIRKAPLVAGLQNRWTLEHLVCSASQLACSEHTTMYVSVELIAASNERQDRMACCRQRAYPPAGMP